MTREEAIKIVQSAMVWTDEERDALAMLIPELAESEDERIRKELIDAIKIGRSNSGISFTEEAASRYIAYLEKQKDSNDMEFHEGYTLGFSDGVKSVEQKETHYTKRNALFDKCVENCDPAVMKKVSDEVDEMLKKEQKLEPVFKVGDKIKLKSEPKYPYREIVDIKNGAYYFDEAVYLPFDNQDNWEKEQKSVDYEAELKKCKDNPLYFYDKYVSIKQKPAEIDEYTIIKKHITEDSLSSEVNKRLTECGWYVTEQKPIPANSVGLKEQKQEWSEEDEDFINMLILHFNYLIDKGGDSVETYKSYIEKLKSLRPQPKQEWSEKDEKLLDFWLDVIDRNDWRMDENFCKASREFINRLKSLSPDNYKNCNSRWKPSEEQMEALKDAVRLFKETHFEKFHYKIESLYEQLKKL